MVSLSQLPINSIVVDVVVADISHNFGMLLSSSCMKRIGGTLQMDMSYVTIPVFGGEYRRLYREVQLTYLVSDPENTMNHPIYVVEYDLGSCILHVNSDRIEKFPCVHKAKIEENKNQKGKKSIWKMYFDGSSSREGLGAGIIFIYPSNEAITLSHKFGISNYQ